jgi:hypothetical protein
MALMLEQEARDLNQAWMIAMRKEPCFSSSGLPWLANKLKGEE